MAMTACSDDEPDEPFTWHPTLGQIYQSSSDMVAVTSEPHPQSGQKHRSSPNFDTNGLTGGDHYLWTCSDKDASFKVNHDVHGSDETIFSNVHDGAITSCYSSDHLYIADPQNASADFTVTVSRVDVGEGYIYINSAKDHMEGQDHRASDNFAFGSSLRYQVECPNGVSFRIRRDVSAWDDETIYTGVKNNSTLIVNLDISKNLYVADVEGASGPFTITLKPCYEDTEDWMSKIPDDTNLCALSIPGTHDSGTGVLGSGVAKCQNYNIDRQLVDGIRFFDIRIDDGLDIVHGPTDTNQDLDDILTMFNNFLEKHTDEVILMSIKNESDGATSDFYDYMKDHIDKTTGGGTGRIVTTDVIPNLGDVRGKIVVFRRMPLGGGYDSFGIDCHSYWPDDTTGETDIAGGYKLYVEDRYYSADEFIHNTGEKADLVKDALVRACKNTDADKKTMFLIFNSVAGRLTHTPWSYAWGEGTDEPEIDPIMNEALNDNLDYVQKHYGNKLRTGVILMDYYNKHGEDDPYNLARRIINFNFNQN